ncbi:MAG: FAD-dependent oxidoreductase [Xanthomonadaceae bacterium]|nr:FAD-dependent oxidoreductase [Xanthomonadaceae bacterium]MDE2248053.1 FAD-dependent oxidoreductase [Xanthomonadaceae bacterium]
MTRAGAPIIVVGGGVAGLATALALAPRPVRLLCRANQGSDTASALAQGGIAAAVDRADSSDAHALDTLVAGARHNDAAMVRWLCRQAPAAIGWLEAQGVGFDRDAAGRLQLGREGGHRASRIVHAGGDASGAAITRGLRRRAQHAWHIQWRSDVDVQALRLRGGTVDGVRVLDSRGRRHDMDARAVVLATGGIGALFARTSNPAGANGSGLALAMAAGARLRDIEFVQFHPTALDIAGGHCLPLITEALRGAGARLQDGPGRPLMAGLHPLEDLAPRDVVARRVAQAQRTDGGAWLDARDLDSDWERCFPTVLAACLAHGIDPRRQRIPVTAAAHFHMGGVAVDADGRSSVAGLYAVGEVACNGVHGANRLASNSLLEGVLCGRRVGESLARLPRSTVPAGAHHWVGRGAELPPAESAALRDLLWQAAGPERDAAGLKSALQTCAAWRKDGWQAQLAHCLLTAALQRDRSLGAHYRTDAT